MAHKTPFNFKRFQLSAKTKRVIVLSAFASFLLACIAADPIKPSMSQEKTDEPQVREQHQDTENTILPLFVGDCVDKNSWLLKEIDIRGDSLRNPYFQRGDLDGDGRVDYAIVVESKATKQEGLLICLRNKERKALLLGLDQNNPPPFWRLVDWDIEVPNEVIETVDFKRRPIGIRPRGESIVMKWEDALGFIYWDGNKFQWKQVILNSSK